MSNLYLSFDRQLHICEHKLEKFGNMADDDNFQDATEHVHVASEMDLMSAAEESFVIFNLMLNNKPLEGIAKAKSWASKSIYHALSHAGLATVQAIVTFDQKDIESALEILKSSSDLCNRRRHKTTMTNNMVTKMVVRPNYNTYEEEEVHAELCYAECLLFRALVTFIQDDNLMSFIKGGLRIRSCYQSYKTCVEMLEHRDWKNETLKKHFESGVLLGVGTFNLLISILPGRVLKLLEFVGFSGNRDVGYNKLEEGRKLERSVRGPMCSLALIGYHIIIRYALGKGCQDLDYVCKVMAPMLKAYPNSAIIQYLAGRLENVQGNAQKAIAWLEKSLKSTGDWKEFKHCSHWELIWCYMLKTEYKQAIPHIEVLIQENSWSKSTFNYMKAAQLIMSDDCTDAEKALIVDIMKKVPELRMHLAGKSIPLEKFFCKKAEKFTAQGNVLYFPVYEMLYVWNYFLLLKGKVDILNRILSKLDRFLDDLKKNRKGWEYYGDNYCLATFLKGLCLRYLDTPLSAEECFKEVALNKKSLKDDTYLIACSAMEMGFICIDTKNYPLALQYLETAKNEKAFFMEFRVHQGFEEIAALTKKKTAGTPTTPTSPGFKTFPDSHPLATATKL